ncbi:hypothetical protein WG66_007655 [Moniliophthora roreri]|nr:hypothetical protein WG66_007655 [Moniliophthora roreri]
MAIQTTIDNTLGVLYLSVVTGSAKDTAEAFTVWDVFKYGSTFADLVRETPGRLNLLKMDT